MFSFYVDPARIDPDELFPKEVSRYVSYVRQAKPSEPGGRTLVPGDPEVLSKEKRLSDGIPLPENTWQSIVDTAVSVGIEEAPAAKPAQA